MPLQVQASPALCCGPAAVKLRQKAPVGIESVHQAIQWCGHFRTHAERLYGCTGAAETDCAKRILSRIRKGEIEDGFTARDLKRKNWAGMDAQNVEAALALLVDHGYLLACLRSDTGGRSRTEYLINPACLG